MYRFGLGAFSVVSLILRNRYVFAGLQSLATPLDVNANIA